MRGKDHFGNTWSNVSTRDCRRSIFLLAKSHLQLLTFPNQKGMGRIQASQTVSNFVSNPKEPSDYFVSSLILCHNLIIISHTKTHKLYVHRVSSKLGRT